MIDFISLLRLTVTKREVKDLYLGFKEEVDKSDELRSLFKKRHEEVVNPDTDDFFVIIYKTVK